MRNIWTIVKKELMRVFTDRRVIFSLFLLPPLTIYLIYGLMGMSAEKQTNKEKEYTSIVYVVNAPDAIGNVLSFQDYIVANEPVKSAITFVSSDQLNSLRDQLKNQQIDLIIDFPSNFSATVNPYQEGKIPQINMYYNINKTYSQNAYYNYTNALQTYSTSLAGNRVDLKQLNVFTIKETTVGDVEKAKGSVLGMLLPLLLIIYLMAGAMGIGIESIAGEKERGTIATLLVTPIRRSQIAIGKIISIAFIAVLSSISSFIGLLAVLPQFAKIGGGGESLEGVKYSFAEYGMIFGIMFSAVLLFVAMIVVVSTYSKTVKEAGTLVMPLYLIVMGASFFNMFSQEVSKEMTTYIIPVYNVVVALKAVFQFDLTGSNFVVTVVSTLVYTLLLIFLIQKMFRSEKVMFNK